MQDIENVIQEHWAREEGPIMDGILYADGSILEFAYETVERGYDRGVAVQVSGRSQLADRLAEDPDIWTELVEMDSIAWDQGGLVIHCGGAGFGSDGFISATRAGDGRLVWLLISQRSNPLRSARLDGDQVVATSEIRQEWRLALPRPEAVAVRWSGP